MRINLKLDGMEIWFAVKGYGPSTSDNWDSQWCDIEYSFCFGDVIHYAKDADEVLLSCEIEEMEAVFTDLLDNQYTGNEYSISETNVNKLQNASYEALTISPENSPIAVSLA